MAERIFGIETEYGLSAVDSRGARTNHGQLLDALLRRARAALPYLPDEHSNGLFLQNGARFYVDCGGHPEVTTPECSNPWDAVRYVRAGEAVLQSVATPQTSIFRANVDYSGTRATWGCHESYMHAANPAALPAQLIPHLVSRIVFSGAGGFDNTSPGIEFTLSPRAVHIGTDVSGDSTGHRGIFHTKNEPLCGTGYSRLHVIFGESLCSDLAVWLKVGTTALVVAMCEAGIGPGDAVALRAPVTAMRAFASDVHCRATAMTVRGGWKTAVEIQRHYLEQAERHAAADFMPPWAGDVCREWRAALDALGRGWEAVSTTLDWAIKLGVYRDHARRRGVAWEALPSWNRMMGLLAPGMGRAGLTPRELTAGRLRDPKGPIADEVARLMPRLETMGLRWEDAPAVVALRDELFEIDMRFGQLGARGIFSALDRAQVLAHQIRGVDDVEHAITHPPAIGRAQVRGRLVRELTGNGSRYHCDWQGVWDAKTGKRVDLSDPFAATGEWTDWSQDDDVLPPRGFLSNLDAALSMVLRRRRARPRASSTPDPVDLNREALEHRTHDRLDEAERLLREAIAIEDTQVPPDSPKRPHRRNNLAMVLLRAGKLDEASAVNAEAWRLKGGRHDLTSGRVLFVRIALHLLAGLDDVSLFVGQLKTLFGFDPLECRGNIAPTWEIPDVLAMLERELPAEGSALLTALAEVLNDPANVAPLEASRLWNGMPAYPLGVPWGDGSFRA